MKILHIDIASRASMTARAKAAPPGAARLGFASMESVARVLGDRNRALLDLIAARQPRSLGELAALSGRAKSNLSRTLKTMRRFGLVAFEKGEGGALMPRVFYAAIRIELRVGGAGEDAPPAAAGARVRRV